MKNRLMVLMSAVVVASASGCSDGTSPEETVLTPEELEALFTELGEALDNLGSGVASSPNAPDGAAAVPVEFSFSIAQTIPCDTGSMSFTGSTDGVADNETGFFDATMDFLWDFADCVLQSPDNPTVFTLNGAPDIRYIADIALDPETSSASVEGSQDGAIRIQTSDGRDVNCVFDVTYSATSNLQTGQSTQSVSGSVCGVDVEAIASFSVVTG